MLITVIGNHADLITENGMKKKSKHGGAGKSDGNQFFAFRVDAKLMRAFKAAAKKAGVSPTDLTRQLMTSVCQ